MFKKIKALSKEDKTNYVLVWGLVAVSGFPYFYSAQIFIMILLFFATLFYLKRSIIIDSRGVTIIGAFFIVEVLQVFIIKPFEPQIIAGTFMRLFVSFVIVSLCKDKFVKYYVNIIYVFCIISFIFFVPSVLFPQFFYFFLNKVCPYFNPPGQNIIEYYQLQASMILFTFDKAVLEFRNPGPFWEQGAFAIFILFAMIFNLPNEKKLMTKKNIVFSIAVISTLSTSGFIAFFILVMSFYFVNESFIKRLVFISIAFPLAFTLYYNLEFLSKKIENNIEIAGEDNTSRFGSGLSDLKDFAKSPFIGWGRGSMRFGGKKFTFFSEEQHRNNGLSSILATYGIFIFIFYFYNYYKSLKYVCLGNNFNTNFASFSLAIIFILGFSQTIFQYPFFSSIMFIHLGYTLPKTGFT